MWICRIGKLAVSKLSVDKQYIIMFNFYDFLLCQGAITFLKFDLCDIILYPTVSRLADQTQECLYLVPAIQLPGCGTPVLQVEQCARFMGMKGMSIL